MRRRSAKPLRRTTARRPELRTVVVFCEGKRSESDYVKGLQRLPEIANITTLNLVLDPRPCVPLKLVERAADRLQEPDVDECWCLFDVEWPQNHPKLPEAKELARTTGVKLAISNPCFELWLVLHHQDFNRFENTREMERLSQSIDKRDRKSIDASIYMPLREHAIRRAESLEKRHQSRDIVFPLDNPSSGVHHFLKALKHESN